MTPLAPPAPKPVPWADRKRAELAAKLAGISADLERWVALSTTDPAVQKNHSQVTAVVRRMAGLLARTTTAVAAVGSATSWQLVEEQVLDLYRIWGFFRDQLHLRTLAGDAPYLLVADEFAWACYRRAQVAAIEAGTVTAAAVREPPLVGLGADASPIARPRHSSYESDIAGLTTRASRAVARSLPVPVVSVPRHAPHHLPEVLVLGHEVGHHVEDDLGLTGTIAALVAHATGHDADWARWAGEVFADVYGVLNGGPCFASVLADFVHVPGTVAASDTYPPVPLRLAVVLAVVREVELEAAKELADRWRADGIPTADDPAATAVARNLVNGPYGELGGTSLPELLGRPGRPGPTAETADRLLAPQDVTTKDVRTLLAAAALAFARDPERYTTLDVPGQIVARTRAIQEPGTRYTAGAGTADPGRPIDEGALDDLYAVLTDGAASGAAVDPTLRRA